LIVFVRFVRFVVIALGWRQNLQALKQEVHEGHAWRSSAP
jgi:hypothetical protein